jgi:prophage regulatory protein
MTKRILRLEEVKSRTGRSRSSIYADIQQKKFPKPISLGERAVGWLESEVNSWIESRITESRKSEGNR